MPRKAARPCRYPGCPNLVFGAGRYCDEHARPGRARYPCREPGCPVLLPRGRLYCDEHERQRQAGYDRQRGSASARGYGARWRRLRRMFLARHPLCADPFGVHHGQVVVATEVHHVVPRDAGGDDAFENLQALCKSCHSRATAAERGVGG